MASKSCGKAWPSQYNIVPLKKKDFIQMFLPKTLKKNYKVLPESVVSSGIWTVVLPATIF